MAAKCDQMYGGIPRANASIADIRAHIGDYRCGSNRDSRYGEPPDLWAFLYEGVTKRRFALKPHRAAGTYVLLPLHNFVGVFCLLSWSALVFLFASVKTNPFIYFQF